VRLPYFSHPAGTNRRNDFVGSEVVTDRERHVKESAKFYPITRVTAPNQAHSEVIQMKAGGRKQDRTHNGSSLIMPKRCAGRDPLRRSQSDSRAKPGRVRNRQGCHRQHELPPIAHRRGLAERLQVGRDPGCEPPGSPETKLWRALLVKSPRRLRQVTRRFPHEQPDVALLQPWDHRIIKSRSFIACLRPHLRPASPIFPQRRISASPAVALRAGLLFPGLPGPPGRCAFLARDRARPSAWECHTETPRVTIPFFIVKIETLDAPPCLVTRFLE